MNISNLHRAGEIADTVEAIRSALYTMESVFDDSATAPSDHNGFELVEFQTQQQLGVKGCNVMPQIVKAITGILEEKMEDLLDEARGL